MDDAIRSMIDTALSLDRAGRLSEAADAYQKLLALRPNLANCWYNLGVVERRLGRFDSALAAYQRALEWGVPQPEAAHLNRGVVFSDVLRQPDAAERELKAALALKPDYIPALFNLANLHEDRGERPVAQALYERILIQDPQAHEVLARLANLSNVAGTQDPVIGRLRTALAAPSASPADRASLGFALGRALDAAGAFDEAFLTYETANRTSTASAPGSAAYDRQRQEALIAEIIEAFPSPGPVPPASLTGARQPPIFILGMFRSGSTLVEQVLAAHPDVTAGGELEILPGLVRQELAPFPATVPRLSPERVQALQQQYLGALAARFPGARTITDKRPDNFLYVGLIKRLIPAARIIHTVRNPLDNCLSVYFLHLDQSMAYARDLLDIGHYYRECRRLMAHWNTLYGPDILDFDYDAFVREPRPAIARLLAFCGLAWDERCLAFHDVAAPVRTASVWQVREPLYARSSGRWRNYRRQLEPLRAFLGPLAGDAPT
jgi:tetratricopeptide (TPR) repeat protein